MGKWEIKSFVFYLYPTIIASPAVVAREAQKQKEAFQAVFDEGWEPYSVLRNAYGGDITYYFKRYREDPSE